MIPDDERFQIRQELDDLRKKGARRQELSLHACKRIFFDLGVRPSMVTVRDLTRTGSASDIPKDIELFWQHVRAASEVRITAGTIPAALEEKAGELLGQLFNAALAQAREALGHERAEMQAIQQKADQKVRDAEIRRITADEMLQRSETRTEAALNRVHDLEAQLDASTEHDKLQHDRLKEAIQRLETENDALQKHIAAEQASNVTLRRRIDTLHEDLRQNTEHYTQQIRDAQAQAERRVKPMLVELDSLRSMASTWHAAQRDTSHREFDLIQQLTAARTRNDQLDTALRKHMDEIDTLTRQISVLRSQQAVNPALTEALCALALAGRLHGDDFIRIGTLMDHHVALPLRCPSCHEGEPELSQAGQEYEIFCPECDRSSGTCTSRLEAISRFMTTAGDEPATTQRHDG